MEAHSDIRGLRTTQSTSGILRPLQSSVPDLISHRFSVVPRNLSEIALVYVFVKSCTIHSIPSNCEPAFWSTDHTIPTVYSVLQQLRHVQTDFPGENCSCCHYSGVWRNPTGFGEMSQLDASGARGASEPISSKPTSGPELLSVCPSLRPNLVQSPLLHR